MRVLICGGGVIGACTAYFLARRGIEITVVERTEVACAASGKAGGFLALDWCAGSPLDALARRRFACFRPFTRDYLPLIGRVPRTEGAYVATGHNLWGILNAPATGRRWRSSSSMAKHAPSIWPRSIPAVFPHSTRRCCVEAEDRKTDRMNRMYKMA